MKMDIKFRAGLNLFFPKMMVGLCSPEAEILDIDSYRRPTGDLSLGEWETGAENSIENS